MQKGLPLGCAVSPRPKAGPLSVHDVPAATRGSAGIDLVNQEDMDITLPGEVLLMPSQIQGPLPEGMVGLVLPRSSASKQGLFVVPGVVDSDYGGIIHVQLWSFGSTGQRTVHPQVAAVVKDIGSPQPKRIYCLNDQPFEGVIDSGADVTVIAAAQWPAHWPTEQAPAV
uniref:Peptidase A2 domain-containing protein n=1 Tax=Terrapene triunguis TaxID=2587831 RepID=A0A674JXY8_9SAUR